MTSFSSSPSFLSSTHYNEASTPTRETAVVRGWIDLPFPKVCVWLINQLSQTLITLNTVGCALLPETLFS